MLSTFSWGAGACAQTTIVVHLGLDHYHWKAGVGARLAECPGAVDDRLRQAWEDSAALPCLCKVSSWVRRRFLQNLPRPQKVVEQIWDDLWGQNLRSTRRDGEDDASTLWSMRTQARVGR